MVTVHTTAAVQLACGYHPMHTESHITKVVIRVIGSFGNALFIQASISNIRKSVSLQSWRT
jgi:hypothetical protein